MPAVPGYPVDSNTASQASPRTPICPVDGCRYGPTIQGSTGASRT